MCALLFCTCAFAIGKCFLFYFIVNKPISMLYEIKFLVHVYIFLPRQFLHYLIKSVISHNSYSFIREYDQTMLLTGFSIVCSVYSEYIHLKIVNLIILHFCIQINLQLMLIKIPDGLLMLLNGKKKKLHKEKVKTNLGKTSQLRYRLANIFLLINRKIV